MLEAVSTVLVCELTQGLPFNSLCSNRTSIPCFLDRIFDRVQYSKKVTVLWLTTIGLYQYLAIFKYKLNRFKCGFCKQNSPQTIWLLILILLCLFVCSQGQTDVLYIHLSNAFYIVPHNLFFESLLALNFLLAVSVGR